MARVKGGNVSKNRRRKVLKAAKGYFGSKHRLYKTAQEQTFHSGVYAFRDRKANKRNFRKLWIVRINAACRANDISYSQFINGLTKAGVEVNRKMLSAIAIEDEKAFADLVKLAKDGLAGKIVAPAKKEAKAEVKKEVPKSAKVDYASMTVAELKEAAKNANVEGFSTMKKAELVEALSK